MPRSPSCRRASSSTDVSYGPYLLALTPHSVMGAPYHRLSTGIAVSHGALASAPDDARAIVNATRLVASGGKPTYVAVCGPRPPDGLAEPARGRSLWARLASGRRAQLARAGRRQGSVHGLAGEALTRRRRPHRSAIKSLRRKGSLLYEP